MNKYLHMSSEINIISIVIFTWWPEN